VYELNAVLFISIVNLIYYPQTPCFIALHNKWYSMQMYTFQSVQSS